MSTVHKLLDDPWLKAYRGVIKSRAAHADSLAKRLAGRKRLSNWASAHEYYGLHKTAKNWVFREWAPNATAMWLVGDFSGWGKDGRFALKRREHSSDWEGFFPVDAICHGQYYRLEVEWAGGSGERIPAYARRVVQDSQSGLFAAQVWDVADRYVW